MNFLFPALAAVLQSASYAFDKATLSLKRVSYPTYLTISFPLMAFGNFIAYLLFATAIPPELFEGKLFWMLAVTVLISAGSNVSFYKALDSDNLSEVETLDLFFNLPVIIFSSLLFADERNLYILIPALISSVAIIWSHWQKGRFRMKKKTLYYFLWIVLVAPFGAILTKILLQSWNAISLELVRNGSIAAIFGVAFYQIEKKKINLNTKTLVMLLITNFLSSIAYIFYNFSYQRSGIVYTFLIFSLTPLLVYFAAVVFLKEKFHLKKFVAFLIIFCAILFAQFFA